ncbi:substrate-binding domain-containing protein [Kineosporia succinea]|uniref:ABC-type nitrate/sulfonate/bicarbonate transport system substrate-binding protein n=1 Tax=Kineosporia succinea TaxID=84632 RepID=A0ABT9P8P2_9ACTN|nr:hypothetical protein [Kineosporia succinea]MDP9829059.1 ABC-type nitrate/sulfonate/bicarbonate transport system substrate-binding protein [Kineosporia succinea]
MMRRSLAAGLSLTAVFALAACGGSSDGAATAAPAAAGALDLAADCPATVVLQTDWNPEAEHGHLYQLLGKDYTVDADQKSVSGPLMHEGRSTGVNVEIRSGGPAIGYSTVTSQMYQDKDIMLGYVNTDEAVRMSKDNPITAVFAPLEKSPQMVMWDPATYPDVTDIASLSDALKAKGGVTRYFGGAAYMEYLTSAGILDKSVVDGTYDGTPAKFAAAQGKDAQQGFASAEPFIYQNEVDAWGKPVKYQLVHDAGYPFYSSAMTVRTADLEKDSACLKKLVPVLQQAEVDYFADPAATNQLVLDLVTEFNNGWVYSQGVADYSAKTLRSEGIVSNGDNEYIGDFDAARIQKIIDIDTPIFTAGNTPPKDGLKAEDLFTNEFLDQTIGLK